MMGNSVVPQWTMGRWFLIRDRNLENFGSVDRLVRQPHHLDDEEFLFNSEPTRIWAGIELNKASQANENSRPIYTIAEITEMLRLDLQRLLGMVHYNHPKEFTAGLLPFDYIHLNKQLKDRMKQIRSQYLRATD